MSRVAKLNAITYAKGILQRSINKLTDLESQVDSRMFASMLEQLDTDAIVKESRRVLVTIDTCSVAARGSALARGRNAIKG